jgi:creatinine amidohydrolase/Fe(II)-dependent formamide hydrolase-like protein
MLSKKNLFLVICVFATYSECFSQKTNINKNSPVFIESFTTVELTDKIREGFSTILIYSGGTEETGPHVVLGKHNFRVQSYAQRVAEGLGNALVAPILPFAPNGMAIQQFPGTITLDSLTFSNVNEQVALSMIASGFKHIILMSDHFNSQQPLAELAKKLSNIYHGQNIDVYYASDGYTKARKEIEASIEKQNIVPGGHGGLWDVSETKAISKKLVRPDLFAIGDTTLKGNGPLNERGFSGDPRSANVKQGKQFADLRVTLFIAEIRNHLLSLK